MDEERVTFAEPFGFKFLDPAGCTYHNGEAFQYNLPQRGEKWSQPTMHPEPVEPDGRACGLGRLHQMAIMGANYAPVNWWPWWSRGVGGLVGQDDKKRGWHGLELRRVSPRIFARALRPPFCWGREANLSGADLRRANLYGADLREANLRRANLRGANLSEATLYGANLSGADLYQANLSWANLRWAYLSWANLRRADLSGADLRRADLYGANLSGADLRRADLSGANLTDGQREYAEEKGAIL